jgi:hypothetical protein
MHTCPRFFGRYDFTLSTLTLSLLPILINMGRESYEQDPRVRSVWWSLTIVPLLLWKPDIAWRCLEVIMDNYEDKHVSCFDSKLMSVHWANDWDPTL